MNNHNLLRDRLLRADGIHPTQIPGQDLDRFQQLLDQAKSFRPGRRNIMRNPFAKLSLAAVAAIVAACLGLHFFSDTSSTTWAQVLDRVMTHDTCVYRSRTVETSGPRPDGFEFTAADESMEYRSDSYGLFRETCKNGEPVKRTYMRLQDKKYVALFIRSTDDKLCIRAPLKDTQIREYHSSDPRRYVAKIVKGDHKELGEDTIEGKRVKGIQVNDPSVFTDNEPKAPPFDDFSASFWIDTETELPVWVEVSFLPKGSLLRTSMIWDRFQWGVPLQAKLFVPNITDDYEVIDDDGRDPPDSTPKTATAETFLKNTMAEPYLGDFEHLPQPELSGLSLLGVDPSTGRPRTRLQGTDKIWVTQDSTVEAWPKYEQVQAQLQQELQDKLNIGHLSVNQLVTTGIALRSQFWMLGACLSESSYPYIYASRLLIEKAIELAPERTDIIDQLIECIMSYEFYYTWDAEERKPLADNPAYPGIVTDLRIRQFDLLKARIKEGYEPKWKDFVRSTDLILLCSRRKDFDTALEATQVLLDQVQTGGWTYYEKPLRSCQERLAADKVTMLVTFMGGSGDIALGRYGRRLWIFQGPEEYQRRRKPIHMRHIKNR